MGNFFFQQKNQMINIIAWKLKNERNCPTVVIHDRRQLHVAFGRSPRQGDWSPLGRENNAGPMANTTRRRKVHGSARPGLIGLRRESLSAASTIGKSERRTWHDRTTAVSPTTTSTVWRRDIDVKGLIDRHKKENKKKSHKKRVMKEKEKK